MDCDSVGILALLASHIWKYLHFTVIVATWKFEEKNGNPLFNTGYL